MFTVVYIYKQSMGSADIRLAAVLAAVVIGVVAAQSGEIASVSTCSVLSGQGEGPSGMIRHVAM